MSTQETMEPLNMSTAAKVSEETGEEVKKKIKPKSCGLKKCFQALVDRKKVNLELDVVRQMLHKELGIKFDTLEPELATIFPYLLVYYIKNWPGWQRSAEYYSGKIQYKTWYDKFQKFINVKLNEAITTHYKEAVKDLMKDKVLETRKKYMEWEIADKNTQTDNLIPKALAPFGIEISGKPVLLNTIVFTCTPEGDVILKDHSSLEWDQTVSDTITLKQLITWPHVGVQMMSPIFAFSRNNLHEYRRHISSLGTPLPSVTVDFIEQAKIINTKVTRLAYTLDYLKGITKEFLDALKHVYPFPNVLEAFETVINEFLTDVEELNVQMNGKPTLGNNTSVLFNIGKNIYFRNKKLSKVPPSNHDICYTEVIIPKMETALYILEPEEKINVYLSHLKNFNVDVTREFSLPSITFICTYCLKNFKDGGQIVTHLKEEHKMEPAMLCIRCKQNFSTFELSKVRWKHDCSMGGSDSLR